MTTSISVTPILRWSLGFFLVALASAALGFGGIAGAASGVAQLLFYGFLILAAIALVTGLVRRT